MNVKIKFLWFFILLFVFALSFGGDSKNSYILTMYVGDVKISKDSGKNWMKPQVEMKLEENNLIKTGSDSSCDVLIPKRGIFRIVDNSLVLLGRLREKLEEIRVKKGKVLFSITKKVSPDAEFLVHTEVAIAAVRGTKFIIVADERKVKCSVGEGVVVMRRNIKLPIDTVDEEILSKLEVVTKANQEIELTLDENKALEELLSRVKNNMKEFKEVLSKSQSETQKKVRMIKNVRRVLEELHQFEEMQNEGNEEDETEELIEKVKNKK